MILHYLVSFKGHKCALVVNQAITAGWLLRCHKGEEPHKFVPETVTPIATLKDDPVMQAMYYREERKLAIEEAHREIYRTITRTESARVKLRGSLVSNHPIVARLLADKPDTRKRARRWRIVAIHRGPKGKQP